MDSPIPNVNLCQKQLHSYRLRPFPTKSRLVLSYESGSEVLRYDPTTESYKVVGFLKSKKMKGQLFLQKIGEEFNLTYEHNEEVDIIGTTSEKKPFQYNP